MPEQDLTTPAQYPTATRIEDGNAYDVSGKVLGPVSDGEEPPKKQEDPFAALGATPAPSSQSKQDNDPFAALGATSAPEPQQQKKGPGVSEDDRGVAAGLYRNTVGQVQGMYHAFTDEATDQEKSDLMKKYAGEVEFAKQNGQDANKIPVDKFRNPTKATLAYHRLIDAPGDELSAKSDKELDAANDLWNNQHRWKAVGTAISGATDKILSNIPLVGPMLNNIAERAENGDVSGAMTDIASLVAIEHAPAAVKKLFVSNKEALAAATKVHEGTHQVFQSRLQEVGTATSQAEKAAAEAADARAAEQAGKGDRQKTVQAEENASAAAANAKKAQAALKEAGEARTEASLERNRLERKVNKIQKDAATKDNKAIEGAKEDFKKLAPPAKGGPAKYSDKALDVALGYAEQQHEKVQPIHTKQEMFDALNSSQKDIENQVKPYIDKYHYEPITTNVMMDVQDALSESPQENFVQKGMKTLLDRWPQLGEDLTIGEADKLRADLNAVNRGELTERWHRDLDTALAGDSDFAARYHAADSLRRGTYGALEDKNVKGIAEKRADERDIISVRNAVEQSGLHRGNAIIRGSGASGSLRKAIGNSMPVLGAATGAAVGGATGIPLGYEIGAGVGGYAGKKLGKAFAPGDLSHDGLVQRIMKVKGKGVPPAEINGPGISPTRTGPKPLSLSDRQMQLIQREYGPLHAELATHFGETVGDSTYADLEKQFMEDVQDKQLHGVSLEAPEKKLLNQINQQNASDIIAARQAKAEAEATGKTIGKYNLPPKVEPILRAPEEKMPNGMNTKEGIVHDLAHIVVGDERGLSFEDGIRSHLHPENKGQGRIMSAPINLEEFVDDEGEIDLNKLKTRIPDIATTYVAGGVANDLFHEIPFTENHGLGADMDVLKKFMKKVGFSEFEASKTIAQAAEDAATVLSRPGMREILEGHAALREAGLDETHHISPERVEQILQDVKEGTKRETTTGKSSGTNADGDGATGKSGAGAEGKTKARDTERVSKKSEGNAAGKEEGSSKQPEPPTAASGSGSGTPESNNPALSTVTAPQGGHAGGGVASVEELNRPGRFVKIGRSGMPTDQGKVPDFNLGHGEAGYQVKPDGSYELKSGQETPATKRGVEGYAKQVFGKKENVNPALSADDYNNFIDKYHETMDSAMKYPEKAEELMDKLYDSTLGHPKFQDMADKLHDKIFGQRALDVNNPLGKRTKPNNNPALAASSKTEPGIPQEKTTGEHDVAIKAGGGIPGGIQKGDPEIGLPDYALFHDPTSGSTLALPVDKVTPENVRKQLQNSRVAYAPGNAVKAAKETGGFTFNPKTGEVPKTGFQVEMFPEHRQTLDHPATPDDIRKFMTDKKDVLDKHPELHVGGYGNELNISGRFEDKQAALGSAKKLDQFSIWDNAEKKEIPAGGNSGPGPFNQYPEEQRVQDLSPEAGTGSLLDRAVKHYGLTDEPKKTGYILPNGKGLDFSDGQSARTLDHGDVSEVMKTERGENPRERFANETGAIRFLQPRDETAVVVPGTKITPEQMEFISRAVSQHPLGAKNLRIDLIGKDGKYIGDAFGRGDSIGAVEGLLKKAAPAENLNPALSADEGIKFQIKSNEDTGYRVIKALDPTGKEVGYVQHVSWDGSPTTIITDSHLDAKYRGKGIGEQMYREAIDDARKQGFKEAVSDNIVSDDAARVWRKLGAEENTKEDGRARFRLSLDPENLNPALSSPVAASSVPLMDNPLKIRGTGDNNKISTIDVAKALNNFTKKQLPSLKLGKAEPAEMLQRAKSIAEDEARYQMAQNNTGESWYTKDMATHDKILQDMRPELENPAKLSMFKMVEAVLSSGQKPYANFKAAVKAWDHYHETGEFPPMNPDTNMSWGPRGPVAYSNAIEIINRLIKEKGEQGASDWLLGDHTVKELREYNNAKRGGGGGGVAGKQDDVLPGVMVLGPKRGPFAQNLHGHASAFTADMWVARSWNRWMGTTEIDPNGEELYTDRPRNAKERELIKQSFQETAGNLGLTTSALQAVLWYYEQGLYDVHGSAKESWSFSDAAKRAADEEFNSFKFGEDK